ncbi:MAG: hypothetical protein ABR552_04665, partial [Actinomycetota bacterium]
MTRRMIPVLAVLLLACACGPTQPLNVAVKEIDTNVVIGPPDQNGAVHPPTEPVPVIGFPGIVEPPTIPVPPEPGPDISCPSADPLSPVHHQATPAVTLPPLEARYAFRNDSGGTFKQGDKKGALPTVSQRQVTNIIHDASASSFTYDVVIPGPLGMQTRTTYHVYPDAPNAAEQSGIY